jgi:phage terminase large subunit-like protein
MKPLQSISPESLRGLSRTELTALAKQVEELAKRKAQNQIQSYVPYPKQMEFHKHGIDHDERLLMAANQVGKTFSAGCEISYHLTGEYPDWWPGRTWNRPTRWWAGGVTQESTRDNPQRILLGEPAEPGRWGTGTIPGRKIVRTTNARGIPNAVNSIVVKHASGKGNSVIVFKNYEQGRPKWMGETLDGIWCDEEPPVDLYSEAQARVAKLKGMIMVTFTPLLGMSEVVRMFLSDAEVKDMVS